MADFRVTVTYPARRDLARLPRKEQLRIAERIKSLQTSPFPRGNTIKKIQGTDYRVRQVIPYKYRVPLPPPQTVLATFTAHGFPVRF